MTTNTGGPAFPRNYNSDGHNGMTLRDYFAAKAMQGVVSSAKGEVNLDMCARWSYKTADALLKARLS